MSSSSLPLNVAALAKVLKKEAGFFRWMQRRYSDVNEEQAAAFGSASDKLTEIRQRLLDGEFTSKELFTGAAEVPQAANDRELPSEDSQLPRITNGGYYCEDEDCWGRKKHLGPHIDRDGNYFGHE